MNYIKEIIKFSYIAIISLYLSVAFFISLPISSILLVWNSHHWVRNLLITEIILALTFFFIARFFDKAATTLMENAK